MCKSQATLGGFSTGHCCASVPVCVADRYSDISKERLPVLLAFAYLYTTRPHARISRTNYHVFFVERPTIPITGLNSSTCCTSTLALPPSLSLATFKKVSMVFIVKQHSPIRCFQPCSMENRCANWAIMWLVLSTCSQTERPPGLSRLYRPRWRRLDRAHRKAYGGR